MIRLFTILFGWCLLLVNTTLAFDRSDTLRGSNGPHRAWWDAQHYDLNVHFNLEQKSISGRTKIKAKIIAHPTDSIQIDLQNPMEIDQVLVNEQLVKFIRDGNVFWISGFKNSFKIGDSLRMEIQFHGQPQVAKNPPWDGGLVFTKDKQGHPWVAVACQGVGASVWWPCKDFQGDEPDQGARLRFDGIPKGLSILSNGNGQFYINEDGQEAYWQSVVRSPINLYDVTFYIGDYTTWQENYQGEKQNLTLTFSCLTENLDKAKIQFKEASIMLKCFEHWFGPYPFYEEGYRLIEAPYLGMEHQSAIAYGNHFKKGYLGMDRSHSEEGLHFDYIIIHESGHEWFGNSITAADVADNWIHEGFTSYSEALYLQCTRGKNSSFKYAQGLQKNITNTRPVIGQYGVNNSGPGDMYDKGACVLHMIRVMINDDEKFRQILRGLNKKFYHQIVSSHQVEQYIIEQSALDLEGFFDVYLRSTILPKAEFYNKNRRLHIRLQNVP